MTETEDERSKRGLRELEGKNIAHYSTLLTAWIQTKMERDKTLVTLSSAGIGLLVTILTTAGVSYLYLLILFLGAFVGFGLCIWTSLQIYQLNSTHLENELRSVNTDLKLEKYDKRSLRSFLAGVICICLIGLFSAYFTFNNQELSSMNDKKLNTVDSSTIVERRSLDGIESLKPGNTQSPAETQNQNSKSKQSESTDKKG